MLKIGDLVVNNVFHEMCLEHPIPPIFQISEIKDRTIYYFNHGIDISYVRIANDMEIKWYNTNNCKNFKIINKINRNV